MCLSKENARTNIKLKMTKSKMMPRTWMKRTTPEWQHSKECMWCQWVHFYMVLKVYNSKVTRGTEDTCHPIFSIVKPSERSWHVEHTSNMKALCLMVRKLRAELMFSKSRSKVKITCSKFMVPLERSCHAEHTCQIWNPYVLW